MDYGPTVALLRRMPMLAGMDARALKMLAFSATHLLLEDGEILCSEGEAADGVYIIDEGTVEVYVEREGASSPIAQVGRHGLVGELAVILNQPRAASVKALGPVKVLRFDADVFLQLITSHPDAALGVIRTLGERLTQMIQQYEELAGKLAERIGAR
ncbi:MAG: cyclic nucleotide-binding domain-containing protein [Rhodospirillales bacterium]